MAVKSSSEIPGGGEGSSQIITACDEYDNLVAVKGSAKT